MILGIVFGSPVGQCGVISGVRTGRGELLPPRHLLAGFGAVFGELLERLGDVLGESWGNPGGVFGPSWGCVGSSWGVLDRNMEHWRHPVAE